MRDEQLIKLAERLESKLEHHRAIFELTAAVKDTVTELHTLAARAHGVPEGWKLVPVVPTHEMKMATCDCGPYPGFTNLWSAALSAAPAPDPVPVAVPACWRVMRATSRVLGDDWELHDPYGNGSAFRKDEVPPIVSDLLEALTDASSPDTDNRTAIAWRSDSKYGVGYSFANEFFDAFPTFPNPPAPDAAQAKGVPEGWVLVPRALTAENGAKYALIGEKFGGHVVPWAAVKAVHRAVVAWAESAATAPDPVPVAQAKGEAHADDGRSSWSLHDRVEFALRDAGFGFDEAFAIAQQAAQHAPRGAQVVTGSVAGRLNGYLPRQRAVEIILESDVPQWMTEIPPPMVAITLTVEENSHD